MLFVEMYDGFLVFLVDTNMIFFLCEFFFGGGGGGCGCSKIVQYIKNRLNNMYLLCTVYSFLTLSEAKLAHTSGQDQPGKKADGK